MRSLVCGASGPASGHMADMGARAAGHWPSQSQPKPKFLAAPGQATRCQSKASKSPLALQRPPCSAGAGGRPCSRCSHCSIKLQDALRNAGVPGPAWGRLQQRRRSAATDSRLGTLGEIQARRLRVSAKLHSRDRASLATWPTLREPRDTRSSRPETSPNPTKVVRASAALLSPPHSTLFSPPPAPPASRTRSAQPVSSPPILDLPRRHTAHGTTARPPLSSFIY